VRHVLVAGLLFLGGCSSVFDLAGGTEHGPHAFGGLRTWPDDVAKTLNIPTHGCAAMDYLLPLLLEAYVDLPCSLAGDLALLPITIWFEIFRN
jgi:uncharacterized protein YceK